MSKVTGALADAVAVTDVVSVGTIHCGMAADVPSGREMSVDGVSGVRLSVTVWSSLASRKYACGTDDVLVIVIAAVRLCPSCITLDDESGKPVTVVATWSKSMVPVSGLLTSGPLAGLVRAT